MGIGQKGKINFVEVYSMKQIIMYAKKTAETDSKNRIQLNGR